MTREEFDRRFDEMECAEDERDADGSVTFDGDPLWDAYTKALADEAVAEGRRIREEAGGDPHIAAAICRRLQRRTSSTTRRTRP